MANATRLNLPPDFKHCRAPLRPLARIATEYETLMPLGIEFATDLKTGDYYEDCAYHPCVCIHVEDGEVCGVSLIDGSYPRSCSVPGCGVRRLSLREALHWKFYGPIDADVPEDQQWWHDWDAFARGCFPPISNYDG